MCLLLVRFSMESLKLSLEVVDVTDWLRVPILINSEGCQGKKIPLLTFDIST